MKVPSEDVWNDLVRRLALYASRQTSREEREMRLLQLRLCLANGCCVPPTMTGLRWACGDPWSRVVREWVSAHQVDMTTCGECVLIVVMKAMKTCQHHLSKAIAAQKLRCKRKTPKDEWTTDADMTECDQKGKQNSALGASIRSALKSYSSEVQLPVVIAKLLKAKDRQ